MARTTESCVIAFMPCFNEAGSVAETIRQTLDSGVSWVLVTDDGSKDESLDSLKEVADRTKKVFVIRLIENRGVAEAKLGGFALAWLLFRSGAVPGGCVLAKLDSDGQHRPWHIPRMVSELEKRDLDFILSYRDFSNYPVSKRIGNFGVSCFASLLTGRWLRDSMSGLKVMRMSVVGTILEYFTGCRYAAAQEITMIPCMTGYRVANDYPVDIPLYRSGSGWRDGYSVLKMSLVSWWRVHARKSVDPDERAKRVLSDPNLELVRSPIRVSV